MLFRTILLKPVPLHIPDSFLSLPISLAFWAASAALVAIAVRRTREQIGDRQIPLIGVMAAFIFAAQMINFPVAGGTSGHLLGGALAAITLGPWAGMLAMTAVIGVQAILFQDGGLLVMGANIFNMGLLTTLIGYGLYRSALGRRVEVRLAVAGVAAWLSVMAGALATSLQLWLSSTSPLRFVAPAMLGVHAFIGVGEALITVAALAFLLRTQPHRVAAEGERRPGLLWLAGGLAASLAVILLAPLASTDPDGLQRVALDLGFDQLAAGAPFQLLPGYSIPGISHAAMSTILAGAIGAVVIAGLVILALRLLQQRQSA